MFFFREDNNHILNFARHSYSKSIADVLLSILRCDNMNSGLNRFNPEIVWGKKTKILSILVENLNSQEENKIQEYCMNVPVIINELVKVDEWMQHLTHEDVVAQLLQVSA